MNDRDRTLYRKLKISIDQFEDIYGSARSAANMCTLNYFFKGRSRGSKVVGVTSTNSCYV